MTDLCSRETSRLLELDEKLRAEADDVLDASGLGEILQSEGFRAVGSYTMRTMTWRDLDFDRAEDPPDWNRHWSLGARLAKSSWVWKFSCAHAYRQPGSADHGLYWGLRLSDPAGGPTLKVDMWTARAEEFSLATPNRTRWDDLLTDDTRSHILAIKEAVCALPEYRRDILSVHIYEAVLDCGVRGVHNFKRWWRGSYG